MTSATIRNHIHNSRIVKFRGILAWLFLLLAGLQMQVAGAAISDFDHFATGFPLTGGHRNLECDSCHLNGIFAGTPTACERCHNNIRADGESPNHIQTDDICDNCHTTIDWRHARFDHGNVSGDCSNCHNGAISTGKDPDHIASDNSCELCHSTFSWTRISRVDHSAVRGTCESCHNGVIATGPSPSHIPVNGRSCEECHNTVSWSSADYDHAGVTDNCSSCHNGSAATGKHAQHIPSTQVCESCHSVTSWVPVIRVDHSQVQGSCVSCHNGTIATGMPSGHFVTTQQCDSCHTTSGWLPVISYVHTGNYPGDHGVSLTCTDCHTGNSEEVPWSFPAYAPDCAACHASDYDPGYGPHSNLSDDRDCAGSGCHSVSDRNWN
jgi:hypothetical protein